MPHPIDIHVGKRLQLQRQLTSLTQTELGKLVDVTFQQIQKYELGKNRISASRLFLLSETLKVPISFFFEEFRHNESSNDFSELTEKSITLSPRETLELVRAYSHIKDDNIRKRILALINAITTLRS